jgi:hypothetical protein
LSHGRDHAPDEAASQYISRSNFTRMLTFPGPAFGRDEVFLAANG